MAIILRRDGENPQRLSSLAEAEQKLREIAVKATEAAPHRVKLELEHAHYRLNAPLTFSAEDTPGFAHVSLSVCAADGASPVISDLAELDPRGFRKVEGKPYLCYHFPRDREGKFPHFRDFYVDGKRIPMAKSQVFSYPFSLGSRRNKPIPPDDPFGLYVPLTMAEQLASEPVAGAELHLYVEWEWFALRVESVVLSDTVRKGNRAYALVRVYADEYDTIICGITGCLDIGGRETFLLNSPAFLCEPNTYAYDYFNGILYYMPPAEGMPKSLAYPLLENLFVLRGMQNVLFKGLTFRGTSSGFLCERGYGSAQANNEKRLWCYRKTRMAGRLTHGALTLYDTRNVTVSECRFEEIGTNGVLSLEGSARLTVRDSLFEDIGMSAVSVGNPNSNWADVHNRNYAVLVTNNRFVHIAYEYPTAPALCFGPTDGLTVTHNTVFDCAYSAVSAGWSWDSVPYEKGEKVNLRDASIAFNRFIDYMQLLRDGGAVYVLGGNCTRDTADRFNFIYGNYAEREMYVDASKRGYYLDGSSSNWEVYDNVSLGSRLPVFAQFHTSDQYTWHNSIHDIYTDYPVDSGNHAPWRDTVLGAWYCVPRGIEALFAAYPKAKEIFEASGCRRDD